MKIEIEIEERRFKLIEKVASLLGISAEELSRRLLEDAVSCIPDSLEHFIDAEELKRRYRL